MPSFPVAGVEYLVDLIVAETASWNYNLVNKLFRPCEAALIPATPLICRLPPDKLIWHYDAKCLFLVNSAYKVAFNRRFEASSSHLVLMGASVWKSYVEGDYPGQS
ncbi:hypothetical protein ACFX15_021039 [Malus domestica]